MENSKVLRRLKRKKRVRNKISGTKERPRVSVFRSNKYFYAQAIDDTSSRTLAASSGKDVEKIAEKLAKDLNYQKINKIVFDRSGYQYHGRVKKLAEVLREKGVNF